MRLPIPFLSIVGGILLVAFTTHDTAGYVFIVLGAGLYVLGLVFLLAAFLLLAAKGPSLPRRNRRVTRKWRNY